jgi:hypothetical protein
MFLTSCINYSAKIFNTAINNYAPVAVKNEYNKINTKYLVSGAISGAGFVAKNIATYGKAIASSFVKAQLAPITKTIDSCSNKGIKIVEKTSAAQEICLGKETAKQTKKVIKEATQKIQIQKKVNDAIDSTFDAAAEYTKDFIDQNIFIPAHNQFIDIRSDFDTESYKFESSSDDFFNIIETTENDWADEFTPIGAAAEAAEALEIS